MKQTSSRSDYERNESKKFWDKTDQQLLIDLIKGDESSFEEIYKRYFTNLCNYSFSIVGDLEVASDLVQNVYVSLWEKRKHLCADKSVRNYLLKCTHNNSLRHLKTASLHQKHQELIKQEKQNEVLIQSTELERIDYEQQVFELLNKLPKRGRQVTIMSHIDQKKSADIANELNISVRTVSTILYQSMKKLKELAKF